MAYRQNWPRGLTQRVLAGSPAVFNRSAHSAGPRKKEGRHGSLVIGIWGHLGAILGSFRGIFEPSWGHLGASWGHLGPSWGYLGPSWGHLGRILGILSHLRGLKGFWRGFGGVLEASKPPPNPLQNPSKPPPKRILNHLGAILRQKTARGGLRQGVSKFLSPILGKFWGPKLAFWGGILGPFFELIFKHFLDHFWGHFGEHFGTRSAQEGAKMGPRGPPRASKTQNPAFAKTLKNY